MQQRIPLVMSTVATLCFGLLVGCGSSADRVVIDGSSTVYPISEAMASKFGKTQDNVKVQVGQSGTGGGFKRFVRGETDISDASRPIKPDEFAKCKENKVSFIEIPVAYDGLTIVVHKDNDWVESLTIDQLKSIFLSDEAAKTWNKVKGAGDNWPEEEIKLFIPGTDSGTFDYFKEVLVGTTDKKIRPDVTPSENDNILVRGVAAEKYAIGFFGAAYYFENKDKLKAVKIVNPESDTPVGPEPAKIESGEYAPFSRPLFIYVKEDSLKQPHIKAFVEFYLKNAAEVAKEVGYVPLPKAMYAAATKHYSDRLTGTHYVTDKNEKRSGALTEVYKAENLVGVK